MFSSHRLVAQPSNPRIERTIGADILVKESRKLAPLAAHPPC